MNCNFDFVSSRATVKMPRLISIVALFVLAFGIAQAQDPVPVSPHGSAGSSPASELDRDIAGLRFEELAEALKREPKGMERTYFEGMLANRSGQLVVSAHLLKQAVRHLPANQRQRKALAIATLADDYLKLFRYKEAAASYALLINQYSQDVDAALLESMKDDFGVIQLLVDYPPQTVSRNGPSRVKTGRSTIGTLDASLTVNGVQSPWILDTGANLSAVTSSLAKRLGVMVSEATAKTKGGTNGLENTIHVGLLPQLRIGEATVHNVVLLVFEDEGLKIALGPNTSYQINAILGYPVFQALGAATFTADGYFSGDPATENAEQGSKLFMNKLTPLVEGEVGSKKLLFAFDTGANESQLTKRYYTEFPEQFQTLKPVSVETGGAGGAKKSEVYILPEATIRLGGQVVTLQKVPVSPSLLGTDLDDSYGNLGRDITAGFQSFTLDFSKMRFSFGKRLSESR